MFEHQNAKRRTTRNRIVRLENMLFYRFAPNLHQNRNLSKKKTPKTVVVSGFFDNCRKAVIISWRTAVHGELP